jgi:hypothetical protein
MSTTKLHERIYAPYASHAQRHHRTQVHEGPQEGRGEVPAAAPALVPAHPTRHPRRPRQTEVRLPGWHPTKAAARSALNQALGRHGDHLAPDRPGKPSSGVGGRAQPTLNDLLDHWLAHLQTNKALRLRTVDRYRQLLDHHVRPYLGEHPVGSLGTLNIQQLYDRLAHDGRRTARRAGWVPRTIRQLHLCLHQALGYAMQWHDLPANPAADAEPPAIPADTPAALTPSRSASCSPPPRVTGGRAAGLCGPGGGDRRPHRRAITPGRNVLVLRLPPRGATLRHRIGPLGDGRNGQEVFEGSIVDLYLPRRSRQ